MDKSIFLLKIPPWFHEGSVKSRMQWEICIWKVREILSGFNMYSVAFRIFLAAVMGGCIGMERGHHGRAAGLRTHILVCVGAAMTVMVGLYAALDLGFTNDPMRVSAQVISGIGFLGAGTILTQNKSRIRGLTTAAGLWTTASIGLAAGLGFYWAAVVAFMVVMVTITVLTRLEKNPQNRSGRLYYLELSDVDRVNPFCDAMAKNIGSIQIVSARSGMANHVGLICFLIGDGKENSLLEEIRRLDGTVIAVPTV